MQPMLSPGSPGARPGPLTARRAAFTLIEILVAIIAALLVLGAVLGAVATAWQVSRRQMRLDRETLAAYATLEALSDDLLHVMAPEGLDGPALRITPQADGPGHTEILLFRAQPDPLSADPRRHTLYRVRWFAHTRDGETSLARETAPADRPGGASAPEPWIGKVSRFRVSALHEGEWHPAWPAEDSRETWPRAVCLELQLGSGREPAFRKEVLLPAGVTADPDQAHD